MWNKSCWGRDLRVPTTGGLLFFVVARMHVVIDYTHRIMLQYL